MLSFLLISTLLNSGLALQCYNCSNPLNLDLECETLQDASQTSCSQFCTYYILAHPGNQIVERGCHQESYCEDLKKQYGDDPEIVIYSCFTCNTRDGCNAGSSQKITKFTVLLALFFLVTIKKHLI